ncbi:LuxR C-terminal-related transcriptional regulator [Streptomyces sp. NPDC058955]|uniref:helix-turn-helix transcriptional regulator n=1 Tax=unclassified Streptomyces TaxID=2593676 RepID=UPI003665D7AE
MAASSTIRPPALRLLSDSDDLVGLLSGLRGRPVRELRLALPLRPYDRRVREQATLLSAEIVRRGAQVRVLQPMEGDRDPAYAADTRRLAASGARIRVLPRLSVWMAVADRDLAVVPSDPEREAAPATLLRGPALVGAYQALFDQVWSRREGPFAPPSADQGGPQGAGPDGEGLVGFEGLDVREREALLLLAQGLTDEGISRRTGLSVRTIRRTVAGVMTRMGAQSRFQAGVEAARRQWV